MTDTCLEESSALSMQKSAGPVRFYELDSLRGLAALVVVLHHFAFGFGFPKTLVRFPYRMIMDGHGVLILFFVLSGFVVTLSYQNKKHLEYRSYIVKRVCRLYLPYLGALALSILFALHFHGGVPDSRANAWWVNSTWAHPVGFRLVIQHILFLGNYDWAQFNTAFWFLVHEMRISLVFPFIALAVLRLSSRWSLLLAFVLSAIARPLAQLFAPVFPPDPAMSYVFHSQTFFTLHYMGLSIAGAILAKNMGRIATWYGRLSKPLVGVLAVATVILIGYRQVFAKVTPGFLYSEQLVDWVMAAGARLLIIAALNEHVFQRFLHFAIIQRMGKLSYSIYLVHGTILFALIYILPGQGFSLGIFVLYLILVFGVAEVFHRLVEKPAIALARMIR